MAEVASVVPLVESVKINSGGPTCANCGKPGDRSLMCPKCKELGIRDAIFCTSECFKDNYKQHKSWHKTAAPAPSAAEEGGYVFPPGTHDPFKNVPNPNYTGPLRAVYPDVPVPKRDVPAHIKRPDYATEGDLLLSIPERWSSTWGGSILGKGEEVGRVIGYGLKREVANRLRRPGKILDAEEIEGMKKVCRFTREVLDIAAAAVRPGITTLEIDEIVHNACIERDCYPSPMNYNMFPRSVCTSVNEVICHGIPDARPLEDGDIINLDVSLYHGGFHGDLNATYPVGTKVSERSLELIRVTRAALDEAIRICKPGTEFTQVGEVIEKVVKKAGFSTNRTYVGHGINQLFHAAPNIPHYAGSKAKLGKMKAGMTFTIEPMICTGHQQDVHWRDNWTAVTVDGKPSAQFEETLLITETGVEVLTAEAGWTLPPRPAK